MGRRRLDLCTMVKHVFSKTRAMFRYGGILAGMRICALKQNIHVYNPAVQAIQACAAPLHALICLLITGKADYWSAVPEALWELKQDSTQIFLSWLPPWWNCNFHFQVWHYKQLTMTKGLCISFFSHWWEGFKVRNLQAGIPALLPA